MPEENKEFDYGQPIEVVEEYKESKTHIIGKKIITILLIVIMALVMVCMLTGCNFNKQIFDTQYNFNYWYDYNLNETFEVEKWTDFEDGEQLQLTLKDGTVLLVSSMSGILYSGSDKDKFEK